MPSPEAILRNLRRLFRNIRAGSVPDVSELHELAADWATLLPDVDDGPLDDAVTGYLRGGCPFWPTVGQLLDLVPARKVRALDDADEAWGIVLGVAQRIGKAAGLPENRPKWSISSDPARPAPSPLKVEAMWAGIAAAGGWDMLCDSGMEHHPTMRAAFRGAYRTVMERGVLLTEVAVVRQIAGPRRAELEGRGAIGFARLVFNPAPDEHDQVRQAAHTAARAR